MIGWHGMMVEKNKYKSILLRKSYYEKKKSIFFLLFRVMLLQGVRVEPSGERELRRKIAYFILFRDLFPPWRVETFSPFLCSSVLTY